MTELDQLKHDTEKKIKRSIKEQMSKLCSEITKQSIKESNAAIEKAYFEKIISLNNKVPKLNLDFDLSNLQCVKCNDSIENIFYQCSECKEMILCSKCENRISIEEHAHPFFKLRSSNFSKKELKYKLPKEVIGSFPEDFKKKIEESSKDETQLNLQAEELIKEYCIPESISKERIIKALKLSEGDINKAIELLF